MKQKSVLQKSVKPDQHGKINRRTFLAQAGTVSTLGYAVCTQALAQEDPFKSVTEGGTLTEQGAALHKAADHDAPWGYEGAKGPENWGDLDPAYKVCSEGVQQSPIDLAGSYRAQLPAINLNYVSGPLRIVNNGHTVQCNCPEGSVLTLEGKSYQLKQFHFHTPSEHRVNGIAFDMEIHFVHAAEDGELAVLALMVRQGGANKGLSSIVEGMPAAIGEEVEVPGANFWPASLLPRERTHYRYHGSLTTPPCSEIVTWLVLKTPVQASAAQIAAFKAAFTPNARPVQPRNRRFLLGTL